MIRILHTDSSNKDFIELVKHLDADLAIRDGDDHPFYDQFNKIDSIKYVVVAYAKENKPVGCGAIKGIAQTVLKLKECLFHLNVVEKASPLFC